MGTDYTLRFSELERLRYKAMASLALRAEGDLWERAGIVPGAQVVDLGCGPGAVLVRLARLVGSEGRAVGVDQDPDACAAARAWAAEEGLDNVEVSERPATDSGLPLGRWDAVMLRHVLIHNGPRVQEILAHVLALLKPGGHAVLDEADPTGFRFERQPDDDLVDMDDRYWQVLATHGNELDIGPHLAAHAEDNGFEVVERRGRYDWYPMIPGVRPPSWAGRQAILEAGLGTEADVERWDKAFLRLEESGAGGFLIANNFTVLARRPA